jgi:hypothetical protein
MTLTVLPFTGRNSGPSASSAVSSHSLCVRTGQHSGLEPNGMVTFLSSLSWSVFCTWRWLRRDDWGRPGRLGRPFARPVFR